MDPLRGTRGEGYAFCRPALGQDPEMPDPSLSGTHQPSAPSLLIESPFINLNLGRFGKSRTGPSPAGARRRAVARWPNLNRSPIHGGLPGPGSGGCWCGSGCAESHPQSNLPRSRKLGLPAGHAGTGRL